MTIADYALTLTIDVERPQFEEPRCTTQNRCETCGWRYVCEAPGVTLEL